LLKDLIQKLLTVICTNPYSTRFARLSVAVQPSSVMTPNNSFKPTPHRGVNSVLYATLHAVATPPWGGLTPALGLMTKTPAIFEKVYLQFISCSGEGLQMEILAGGSNGEFIFHRPQAVARILADDNEVRWFEIYTPEGPVRFPLAEIERAIEAGKPDVHGEAWYDKVPPEA
jgi:hypothetical protein